ncbi:hypothetical protein PENTCL1PPCAC_8050, partial [Pristionchus entomophagus]
SMMTEDEPDLWYDQSNGSLVPCSLREAQIWLADGYFTSDTRFAKKEGDGNMGEWRTLEELMERNGPSMPFTEWYSSEEERKEQEEELGRLLEEMAELRQRRNHLQRVLTEASERRAYVHSELDRLVQKYPATDTRSMQTQATLSTVISVQTTAAAPRPTSPVPLLPQISPPPGVDPFALLKSCIGARRKLNTDDVVGRFKQLRIRFDRCDKKQLVQRTSSVFAEHRVKMCTLCRLKLDSTNNVMEHICGGKHIMAMQGAVCADALDFWWSAVETATTAQPVFGANPAPGFGRKPEPGFGSKQGFGVKPQPLFGANKPQYGFGAKPPSLFAVNKPQPLFGVRPEPGFGKKPDPGFGARPEPASGNKLDPSKRSVQGADPIEPPNLPVLSVLRRESKVDKLSANPKDELAKMHSIFKICDKKKLDNDPNTIGLFAKPLLCMICNRCSIDKASNLITHITGNGHVDTMLKEGCPVSQNATDFWMSAVQRACK